MRVFAQVVESGSFAGAAERLGLSTSATSRLVAELETHLQTRLLNRTTRRVNLTEAGRTYYERCVQLLADLEEAEQEAARSAAVPRGTVRLTSTVSFGVRHVSPAIASFLARFPEVRFDVSLSDRIVDLVEEGFDLAVRIGSPGSENLVARRLGDTRLICCASPAYLAERGTPAAPEDLVHHNCLTFRNTTQWKFRDRSGAERSVRVSGNLNSDNGELGAAAAAHGAGIALDLAYLVGPELRAGRLVQVLAEFEAPPLPIYAVYPTRRHLSAKVRLFVDHLIEYFSKTPDCCSGELK